MWLIRSDRLDIFALSDTGYELVETSQFFPEMAIQPIYQQVLSAISDGASLPRAIRQALMA